ncbi:MAG: RluA family pseudouridine synthase [Desulfarculales bacterium]|jgi:23S rRNA pseudouridine1911/1915/1917 synthase|nr:RluA family pseudouridine synthase [Desulfarculales bacterium]
MGTQLVFPPQCDGLRLDQAVVMLLPELTRAQIQRLVRLGKIQQAGQSLKPAHKVKAGQSFSIVFPEAEPLSLIPQQVDFAVLYEDEHIIVVNKPAGLVVHPAAGHPENTLVHGLLHHCRDLAGVGGKLRPGIIHRLDKDTSGALVAAKNDLAHQGLAQAFARGEVYKSYLALVWGAPASQGEISGNIGRHPVDRKRMSGCSRRGKPARTAWRVIHYYHDGLSLLEVIIHTGRTHQIRVHMSEAGFPLVGDSVYGAKKFRRLLPGPGIKAGRQMLHAARLSFTHPARGEKLKFTAPLPEDFRALLRSLKEAKC